MRTTTTTTTDDRRQATSGRRRRRRSGREEKARRGVPAKERPIISASWQLTAGYRGREALIFSPVCASCRTIIASDPRSDTGAVRSVGRLQSTVSQPHARYLPPTGRPQSLGLTQNNMDVGRAGGAACLVVGRRRVCVCVCRRWCNLCVCLGVGLNAICV